MFSIEILKTMYDTVNTYKNTFPIEDRQILDPLTTMIKLALLGFKPMGTKLAIDNNRITYQEPTMFQGVWRWAYGNKRYELHHLLNPIIKAVKRYETNKPYIKLIFEHAVIGLDRLKSSYNNDSSVVTHSLDLYISIINNVMQEKDGNKKVNAVFNSVNEEEDGKQAISIFKDLWSEEEIKLVANMIQQINKKEANTYLEAINTILNTKEERANVLIKNIAKSL